MTNNSLTTSPQQPSSKNKKGPPKIAYLYEVSRGQWIVRDATDLRGGKFHNFDAAMKFVRNDISTDAEIVIERRRDREKTLQRTSIRSRSNTHRHQPTQEAHAAH